MSKKHFQALAEAMQNAKRQIADGSNTDPMQIVTEEIARACKRFNPAFDTQRFMTACIPGNNVRARA